MKLQQLRYLCEIGRSGFNLSRAAGALHTSQPGISRYMQLLEQELGLTLFVREKNRLVDLTPAGHALVERAKRIVLEVENMHHIAEDFKVGNVGRLTIATTPGHARYSLPLVIERFIKRYPRVRLRLRQGYSSQMAVWVLNGEADMFLATGPAETVPDLVLIPCREIHRVILAPFGHALLRKRRVSLEDVYQYPIITYDSEFASHAHIMRAFRTRQLEPNIVLSATDADVMKTYVRAGLGLAIVSHTAYDGPKDRGLRAIDARHLFGSSMMHMGLRRNAYLNQHLAHFIELLAPRVPLERIQEAVNA